MKLYHSLPDWAQVVGVLFAIGVLSFTTNHVGNHLSKKVKSR